MSLSSLILSGLSIKASGQALAIQTKDIPSVTFFSVNTSTSQINMKGLLICDSIECGTILLNTITINDLNVSDNPFKITKDNVDNIFIIDYVNCNIGVGLDSLDILQPSGINNVGIGNNTLKLLTTNDNNVALGCDALAACTGSDNTALGYSSGNVFTTGSGNILIGKDAGNNLTTSDSNNIDIGHVGIGGGESGVIRIGTPNTHNVMYTAGAFISQIQLITISGTPIDLSANTVLIHTDIQGMEISLANGTQGQRIQIVYAQETNGSDSVVITPATYSHFLTTLNTVGDTLELIYYDATQGWIVLNLNLYVYHGP